MTVHEQRCSGFTLMEIMAVVIVMGIGAAFAAPVISSWVANQNFKNSVREAAGLLTHARGQALRTGNVQIVFFETDAQGAALQDADGNQVPVLALDDGPPGSVNQNCKIDSGEEILTMNPDVDNVGFGVTLATARVGADDGDGDHESGWTFTFEEAGTQPAKWVMFRGQGTPFSFAPDCDIGGVGSGAGAIYVTNTRRDLAIVVTALGAVRTHAWNSVAGTWSD